MGCHTWWQPIGTARQSSVGCLANISDKSNAPHTLCVILRSLQYYFLKLQNTACLKKWMQDSKTEFKIAGFLLFKFFFNPSRLLFQFHCCFLISKLGLFCCINCWFLVIYISWNRLETLALRYLMLPVIKVGQNSKVLPAVQVSIKLHLFGQE